MTAEIEGSTISQALEVRRDSLSLVRRPAVRFTTGLKLAGNGVVLVGGLAAWLPVIILPLLGVWAWGPGQLLAAMMVGTLWAIALTDNGSLCGNRRLREASFADLKARHPQIASSCIGFVGLSTHRHLLRQFQRFDTHEDVGSLCATPRSLIFMGDSIELSIARSAITAIEFRIDPCCSFIGLHWIRLSYLDGDATRYLYIQSRDRDRLSDLPRRNNALLKRLQGYVSM